MENYTAPPIDSHPEVAVSRRRKLYEIAYRFFGCCACCCRSTRSGNQLKESQRMREFSGLETIQTQMRTTSDLEVARIMERRPQMHIYRNDLSLPPLTQFMDYHLTIRNPYFMMTGGHPGCSCPYLIDETRWHSLDQCSCPHEDLHTHFEAKNIENMIALLPSRETDILDDLVDSSSDSDGSECSTNLPGHIVTVHRASTLANQLNGTKQVSDEDLPISALISKSGWLGNFEEEKSTKRQASGLSDEIAVDKVDLARNHLAIQPIEEFPKVVNAECDTASLKLKEIFKPKVEDSRSPDDEDDEECEGDMGFLADSRDSSATLEFDEEEKDNEHQENKISSSITSTSSVETNASDEEDDEMTPDEAFNLAAEDLSNDDFLQTGVLLSEADSPAPPPISTPTTTSRKRSLPIESLGDDEVKEKKKGEVGEAVVKVEVNENEVDRKDHLRVTDGQVESNGQPSPISQIDPRMRARWRWALLSQNRDLVFAQVIPDKITCGLFI